MADALWTPLGSVAPDELVDTRLVAHWAAQIAAAASTRLTPRADFSHTNLGWDATLGALTTDPIGGFVVGLSPSDLTLLVANDGEVMRKQLSGATLKEGLGWLEATLNESLNATWALKLLDHDMPEHGVGDGAPFPSVTGEAHGELAHWFSNAHLAVSEIAAARGGSPARCWPHHFDLATLITIEAHDDPARARTVGFGLSPGDGGYAEPYFYVTPWPRPKTDALPELTTGSWHTDGWTGAVLTATELLNHEDQLEKTRGFAAQAIDAAAQLVS